MLWHRAADAKGMSLREFLETHSSPELTEIAARNRIDPYDQVGRIERALSRIEWRMYHRWRDPNKAESVPLGEWLPDYGAELREAAAAEDIKPMTPEQIKANMAVYRNRK